MTFLDVAQTPPLGWNSWDCFGASVREEEVREHALIMSQTLKQYGWEYIVVDIQWSEPQADSTVYHPFYPLNMDEYSRLLPLKIVSHLLKVGKVLRSWEIIFIAWD